MLCVKAIIYFYGMLMRLLLFVLLPAHTLALLSKVSAILLYQPQISLPAI